MALPTARRWAATGAGPGIASGPRGRARARCATTGLPATGVGFYGPNLLCVFRFYCIGHGVLPVFTGGSGDGTSPAADMALLRALAAGKDPLPAPVVVPSLGCFGGLPGMATVPQKLVSRIINKEYIPMYEMLPECWRLEVDSGGASCQSKHPRHALVLDINVWTECFAVMAAILATAYPDKAPHLFAYLRTIVRASRTFESTAWAAYDVGSRRPTSAHWSGVYWTPGYTTTPSPGGRKPSRGAPTAWRTPTTLETARMPQGENTVTREYPGR